MTPAAAQVIGEIQVEGVVSSDPADVLKVVQTKVGSSLKAPVTARSITEDLRRISELERFDPLSIRVETRGTEALKTLVFIVKEYPVVSAIEYTGNTKYKKKRLDTEIGFEEGQPLFFKSWRSWYGLEILALAAIILLLAWIARVFR